ncbi:MAG: hypothetical protein ACRCZG_04040 [Culicoidibacterales bacterium]
MKTYHVVQSFLVAPTPEDPSVNSGLDTWTFETEAEAQAQFKALVADLKMDPDYQAGEQADGLAIVHTYDTKANQSFQIDMSDHGVPTEAVYVKVVAVAEHEELTWWSKQRDQHQQRVTAHFVDQEHPHYVVTQSAVADDAVGNLVASSIITWTFGTKEEAQELTEMLQSALQEDYAPIDDGDVRIVHFTGLDSNTDYRIEVSENAVPTEVIMVELHTVQPNTDGETWWNEHCQQHQETCTKRFFANKQ